MDDGSDLLDSSTLAFLDDWVRSPSNGSASARDSLAFDALESDDVLALEVELLGAPLTSTSDVEEVSARSAHTDMCSAAPLPLALGQQRTLQSESTARLQRSTTTSRRSSKRKEIDALRQELLQLKAQLPQQQQQQRCARTQRSGARTALAGAKRRTPSWMTVSSDSELQESLARNRMLHAAVAKQRALTARLESLVQRQVAALPELDFLVDMTAQASPSQSGPPSPLARYQSIACASARQAQDDAAVFTELFRVLEQRHEHIVCAADALMSCDTTRVSCSTHAHHDASAAGSSDVLELTTSARLGCSKHKLESVLWTELGHEYRDKKTPAGIMQHASDPMRKRVEVRAVSSLKSARGDICIDEWSAMRQYQEPHNGRIVLVYASLLVPASADAFVVHRSGCLLVSACRDGATTAEPTDTALFQTYGRMHIDASAMTPSCDSGAVDAASRVSSHFQDCVLDALAEKMRLYTLQIQRSLLRQFPLSDARDTRRQRASPGADVSPARGDAALAFAPAQMAIASLQKRFAF